MYDPTTKGAKAPPFPSNQHTSRETIQAPKHLELLHLVLLGGPEQVARHDLHDAELREDGLARDEHGRGGVPLVAAIGWARACACVSVGV